MTKVRYCYAQREAFEVCSRFYPWGWTVYNTALYCTVIYRTYNMSNAVFDCLTNCYLLHHTPTFNIMHHGLHFMIRMVKTSPIYHIEADAKWTPFCRWHLKCIFVNEEFLNFDKISLQFVCLMKHNPAMVQIMALCRPDDKLLSESMMVR